MRFVRRASYFDQSFMVTRAFGSPRTAWYRYAENITIGNGPLFDCNSNAHEPMLIERFSIGFHADSVGTPRILTEQSCEGEDVSFRDLRSTVLVCN